MIHIKRCDFKIAIIIAIMLFRKYIDNTYMHNYLPTPPNGCLLLENFQYFYNNQSTMLQALRPNTKKNFKYLRRVLTKFDCIVQYILSPQSIWPFYLQKACQVLTTYFFIIKSKNHAIG